MYHWINEKRDENKFHLDEIEIMYAWLPTLDEF